MIIGMREGSLFDEEKASERVERSKRTKGEKGREGTRCYHAKTLSSGNRSRTTIEFASSFRLFFSHNCILRCADRRDGSKERPAREQRAEKVRCTEKTRPDDDDDDEYSRLFEPRPSPPLTANKTHDRVTIEPSILSFFLSTVFRRRWRKNGVALGPLVNIATYESR